MITVTPTMEMLAHAIDVSALRQSVYASNIANASVDGYRRLEVHFDQELERVNAELGKVSVGESLGASPAEATAQVYSTQNTVKLDEEVGLMAKNALRYQVLLQMFERSTSALRAAIHEGRE